MKLVKYTEPTSELGYMYRCVDIRNRYHIRRYRIVRETPKGFWIRFTTWPYREKWVCKNGKNNFAKRTEEEALEAYYYRKLSHLGYLKQRQRDVECIIAMLAEELDKPGINSVNVLELDW